MTRMRRTLLALAIVLTGTGMLQRVCADKVAQPAGKGRPLGGIVVDAAGKPVAEADVWLVCSSLQGKSSTLAKTTTGNDGAFRLHVPEWWFQMSHTLRQELGLVGHKSGSPVGIVAYSRSSIPPESGVRLELGNRSASTITVADPAQQPLSEARVSPQSLTADLVNSGISEDYAKRVAETNQLQFRSTPNGYVWSKGLIPLPEELTQRLSVTTDGKGVAGSDLFAFAEAGLKVVTKEYGTQSVVPNPHAYPRTATRELPKIIALKPVGRLSGRVAAKDLAAVRGLTVSLATSAGDVHKDAVFFSASAEAQVDAEGKFEVPALAAGALRVHMTLTDTPYRMAAKPPVRVKAGQQAQIEVPLRKSVEVTGIVRERGSNKPIPDLVVLVFGDGNVDEQVMTNAEGRYAARALPGQVHRLTGLPKGYLPLDRRKLLAPLVVPDNVARHELPPIELERAPALRGTVVDEAGKPVSGATVEARWMGYSHQLGGVDFREARQVCDDKGAFAFEDMILRTEEYDDSPVGRVAAKPTEARLKARSGAAVTEKPLIVSGDLSKPVTLRISSAYALALSGKVVDPAGQPVVNARVKVWHRPWMPPPNQGTPRLVAFAGQPDLRTDAAGKFQVARQLERDGEYRAEIEGDGVQATKTGWLSVGDSKSETFPDLVVNRVRVLTGKLLDRQGQPVPSAKITRTDNGPERRETTSDAQGQFRLPDVPDGSGWLFIDAAGFRFHGQALAAGTKEADAVLTRTTEPVAKPLRTLPDVLSPEARLALHQRVFEPVLKRALEGSEDHDKYRVLNRLASREPTRVLELLDKKPFKDTDYAWSCRSAAAKSLARTSLDEAIAIVESMPEPYARAYLYLEFADLLPADRRDRRIELLGQALVQARNVQDASQRTVMLALIADRLWELGEKDRAKKLIDEGHKLAKNLPSQAWAGYARSVMAQSVALTNLPAALELLKDLRDEGEYDRQHGKLALRLANTNPAEAERVFRLLKDPLRSYRYMLLPYVCYRMAPVDLERARRLADGSANPYYRPYSYAKMAQALAKSKPAEATKLLHEAFDQLKAIADSGQDEGNGQHDAAALAAGLLYVAEQIDPQLVPEFLWRALSLRHPPPDQNADKTGHAAMRASHEASLALALARYDRPLARTLLEPWTKRVVPLLNTGGYPHRVYEAALLIDPEWGLSLVSELPDNLKKEIVLTQINLLGLRGDELWRQALQGIGISVDNKDEF